MWEKLFQEVLRVLGTQYTYGFQVLNSSLRVPGTHVYGSLRPIDTHPLLRVRHSVLLFDENSK